MVNSATTDPGSETCEIKPGIKDPEHTDKFFPSGAIAFFVLLVILCLVIWFGIYFLMIERI